MACRTAGRLGWGGGPLLFPPPRLGEASVLQEREGDQRHQGVPVQACPGTALEVVETKFLLQLLMGLLADPSSAARSIRCRRHGRQQPAEGAP